MPTLLSHKLKEGRPLPRIFLWTLLAVFNAFLWLILLAFQWQISLRARETFYFGMQLFPVPQGVPLSVIYTSCALLTLASAGAILRDRSNLAARERLRMLLLQILDSFEIGVVVLDNKDLLTMANDSARRLLPEIPPGHANVDLLEVLQDRPGLREMVRAATRKSDYVHEVEYNLGTPQDPWPARITTLPLKDPQKRTTGTLLLVHDVREAARMERQMQVAERLSALGTLAAALAHEIRNPLEAMDLNLALLEQTLMSLKREQAEGERIDKYVTILESEISRLAAIVENFLSFARPSKSATTEIRLDTILHQLVDLLANQAQFKKVTLDLSVDGPLLVLGSEDRLKQAFLNLAINGLEAMPNGGALRVRAQSHRWEGPHGPEDLAIVRVEDTGVGIPQEQLARLFDPFFTSRPKGTGLGLTIVHRVIHEHNGSIRVASVPGEGSTFTVELPLLVSTSRKETASHA